MKIKSGVWYWLAVASGAVGLLYGMGAGGQLPDRRHRLGRRVRHRYGADPAGGVLLPGWALPPMPVSSSPARCTSSPATP